MNSKAIKILALSVAIILISIAGYFIGRNIRGEHNVTPPQTNMDPVIEQKVEQQKPKPLKKSKYTAINPNYGPIVTTESIKVTYGEDVAFATVPEEIVDKIKIEQKVILLDKEDYVLPLGGKVTAIDGQKVTIKLPEGTETTLLNDRLFVMTNVFHNVKRIPLSAVTQNEDGTPVVWIATPNDKGYDVFQQPVSNDTSAQNEALIQVNHRVSIDNLVIINPNDKLSEDYQYTIDIVEFNAPLHDPIRQAWIDYELYRLDEQQQRMIKAAENCRTGGKPPTEGDMSAENSSTSASCGDPILPTDPMEIFQEILRRMPPDMPEP